MIEAGTYAVEPCYAGEIPSRHVCDGCRQLIGIGEWHVHWMGPDNDDRHAAVFCRPCHARILATIPGITFAPAAP